MKEILIERWIPRDSRYKDYEILDVSPIRNSYFDSFDEEAFKHNPPTEEGELAIVYESYSEYSDDTVFKETLYLKVSPEKYLKQIRKRIEDYLDENENSVIEIAAYLGIPLD